MHQLFRDSKFLVPGKVRLAAAEFDFVSSGARLQVGTPGVVAPLGLYLEDVMTSPDSGWFFVTPV